jgi:hypothetical protein
MIENPSMMKYIAGPDIEKISKKLFNIEIKNLK